MKFASLLSEWHKNTPQGLDAKDWIQIISIVVLAATAFIAPYVIEIWKFRYRSPSLRIKFKLAPPDCHRTIMANQASSFPVYYFRFLVENLGRTQAEECEVVLEKVFKENSAGELEEVNNFGPVNLNWSAYKHKPRTIQPSRSIYCDLGRIQHPDYNYHSQYSRISNQEQRAVKFVFEMSFAYYSQWDCLVPGNYRLVVSVYSKNASKVTREFNLSWSGEWKDDERDMFRELVLELV